MAFSSTPKISIVSAGSSWVGQAYQLSMSQLRRIKNLSNVQFEAVLDNPHDDDTEFHKILNLSDDEKKTAGLNSKFISINSKDCMKNYAVSIRVYVAFYYLYLSHAKYFSENISGNQKYLDVKPIQEAFKSLNDNLERVTVGKKFFIFGKKTELRISENIRDVGKNSEYRAKGKVYTYTLISDPGRDLDSDKIVTFFNPDVSA